MKSNGMLSIITFSEIRRDIILLLLEKPHSLSDIKDYFNISSSEAIPRIRDLQKISIICKEDNCYQLTPIGKLIGKNLKTLSSNLKVIEKNRRFWEDHSIDTIPENFQDRIGELGDYHLVEAKKENIAEPHIHILKEQAGSISVKGIISIFHPEYPQFYLNMAKKKSCVSLVITNKIHEIVIKEYKEIYNELLMHKNVKIYVLEEDINFMMIVTDKFTSMSMIYRNGSFDFSSNIISYESSALRLGEDIFDHYKSISIGVDAVDNKSCY